MLYFCSVRVKIHTRKYVYIICISFWLVWNKRKEKCKLINNIKKNTTKIEVTQKQTKISCETLRGFQIFKYLEYFLPSTLHWHTTAPNSGRMSRCCHESEPGGFGQMNSSTRWNWWVCCFKGPEKWERRSFNANTASAGISIPGSNRGKKKVTHFFTLPASLN